MAHRNAPLAPEGRRRLCERVDAGRPICHVAAEAGIARQTLGSGTPGGLSTASPIRRVLTDNGYCYRARVFNDAFG